MPNRYDPWNRGARNFRTWYYWLLPEGCLAALEEFTPTEEGYSASSKLGQRPSIWEGDLSVVRKPTWTTPSWTLKAGSSFAVVHLFHHVPLATGYGNNPFSSNPEGEGYNPSVQAAGDGRVALDWPFDTANLGFLFVARPGLWRKLQEKGAAQRSQLRQIRTVCAGDPKLWCS